MLPAREPASLRFSLVAGGPFHAILRSARLVRDDGRDARRQSVVLVGLAWGPIALGMLVERLSGGFWDPLLRDYALHVRLLIAVPLLLLAEAVQHRRTMRCIDRFASAHFAQEGTAAVQQVATRAERLREARAPEAVLALLAIAGSQAVLWGPAGGALGVATDVVEITPAAIWYGFVALPLFQFLAYRWAWRWLIWSWVLISLSRLALKPAALHPDRRGGLALLAEPVDGFALVAMAVSAVLAAAWGTRIEHGAVLASYTESFALVLVAVLVVVYGPLLAFTQALWRARFEGIDQYDFLSLEYVRLFARRWFVEGGTKDLLGSQDIQAMADLANSYAIVEKMLLWPFGLRSIVTVVAAVALPVVPLILTQIPVMDLLRHLTSVALGALHG